MAKTLEQRAAPPASERITVALTKRASRELDELQDSAELSKTDAVNRAISLYRLVERARANGRQLAFFDASKEEMQVVELL